MKKPLSLILLFLTMCCGHASGDEIPTISERQTSKTRRDLKAYERGALTFEELTQPTGNSSNLVAFYLTHTNEITVKMLLPIARSYAVHGNFQMGAKLAAEYLNVYSNDWKAWSVLGGAKAFMQQYNEALTAMTNVIRLGSDSNIAGTGLLAIQTERLDILETLIYPRLLHVRNAESTPEREKLDVTKVLVLYSLKVKKKDEFVRALAGIKVEELRKNEELAGFVRQGCRLFGAQETEGLCRQLD